MTTRRRRRASRGMAKDDAPLARHRPHRDWEGTPLEMPLDSLPALEKWLDGELMVFAQCHRQPQHYDQAVNLEAGRRSVRNAERLLEDRFDLVAPEAGSPTPRSFEGVETRLRSQRRAVRESLTEKAADRGRSAEQLDEPPSSEWEPPDEPPENVADRKNLQPKVGVDAAAPSGLNWQTHAIALLAQGDLNHSQIATTVGVHRGTLYRSGEYKAAAGRLSRHVHRGSKSAEGNIEAIDKSD